MAKIHAFEQHAEAYDDWFQRNPQLVSAELAVLRQVLGQGLTNWLEVGVGSGQFAQPLGISWGVEPSVSMIRRAKNRGIDVVTGIAEDLPFVKQSLSGVLMVTTICFVDDLQQSLAEAFRVLRADGALVLGFVDKDSPLGQSYEARRGESKFYREAQFFNPRELLGALQEAGFYKFEIWQTLFAEGPIEHIDNGYGQGAFVVIKAVKGAAFDQFASCQGLPYD